MYRRCGDNLGEYRHPERVAMRNLLITISFDGTNYHGFQVQRNALSICEVFQDALESVIGERCDVKGCSRTDAGVHARMYCLSIKTDKGIPCEKLVLALNRALPEDIAVLNASEVDSGFHARYSCKGKQYVYKIHNSAIKTPFSPKLAYRYAYPLDADMLDREARDFLGTHDFTSFCSIKSDVEDTVRTITEASVKRCGDTVSFTVTGDGFLYNMVRIMTGTLIFIAAGKRERGSIPDIIAAKNRDRAGKTMPACGLYLNRVIY